MTINTDELSAKLKGVESAQLEEIRQAVKAAVDRNPGQLELEIVLAVVIHRLARLEAPVQVMMKGGL